MSEYIKSPFFRLSVLAFAAMPLLIWAQGDFQERTLLKDALSVITILAFFQMIGQFFWARTNKYALNGLKMSKLLKYHKFIGYTFITALLIHPVHTVVPRFFEAGITPADAFTTIITTLNQGVVIGIIAWCLLLVLGITSLARNKLPMKYRTWRIFHGVLSLLFISFAAWHAIDLGRHVNLSMAILISILTAGAIMLLIKTWTFNKSGKINEVKK